MRKLKSIILLLMLGVLSCTRNEIYQSIEMKDGTTIKLKNDKVKVYSNKESFLLDCPPVFTCNYSFLSRIDTSFELDRKYSISGYDDRFIGLWEKASFGKWIEEYGLNSNEEYYCGWIKYVIYLPYHQDAYYTPVMPLDSMGFVYIINKPCFDVEYLKGYPKEVMYTYIRYIGYDMSKNGLYQEIPDLNPIIWNFSLEK